MVRALSAEAARRRPGSVGGGDPPSVAIDVPRLGRFAGELAWTDDREGMALVEALLELVGRPDAFAHESLSERCEVPVVRRIQDENGMRQRR